MKSIFDKIYLVGHGAPPCLCADVLKGFNLSFTFLYDTKVDSSFAIKRMKKFGIEQRPYKSCLDILLNENKRTLILSVNNLCIFPGDLLKNKNITIINYHNSLLPHFRGMHAEAWAIFSGCRKSGITWHLVDENIDTGSILFQESLAITDSMTSLALLHAQTYKATHCFKQNIDKILTGEFCPRDNNYEEGSIYYKRDIPGGGILEPGWTSEKIWRFLRAMDYGPYYNLGLPVIKIGRKKYSWRKYYRMGCNNQERTISFQENKIVINNTIYLEDIYELPLDNASTN